jgi:hypothetical protein
MTEPAVKHLARGTPAVRQDLAMPFAHPVKTGPPGRFRGQVPPRAVAPER